ncbi:MAG: dihydrodipicolinate synthase family protein [Verrucomicrobiales bacterium]|nr:dihydrodipicolinate synthase family protein [Verrucomicrobiales bacterium]
MAPACITIPMLQGIFPVIPTLFTDQDDPDFDAQRAVVRFALEAGAHGVVFPGVASEYNFLTPDERGALIALVAKEVDGRVPIVGGASAATAEEVIVAGQQAEANGIHHLMIMAPAGLGDDLEAHQRFFSEISTALPDAEIILQNAPSPIGAGLNANAMAELATGNESLTYIKEETLPSGPAITSLLATDSPHLKAIFGGGGARYIIDELDRGALGAMPAVELTDLHVAIWDAHKCGDHPRARELYRLSLPLLVSQAVYRMRFTKYLLKRRGVADALHVRAPLPELDEFTQRDIDLMLSDLQAVFP